MHITDNLGLWGGCVVRIEPDHAFHMAGSMSSRELEMWARDEPARDQDTLTTSPPKVSNRVEAHLLRAQIQCPDVLILASTKRCPLGPRLKQASDVTEIAQPLRPV
ncbi:MAG: hypothetical protein EON93_02655 [Burkholderiales bacterium]|nr:MAG: hypothetical protein EON93_02655 [Burkholderiales bacterium]